LGKSKRREIFAEKSILYRVVNVQVTLDSTYARLTPGEPVEQLRLEQDILQPLAGNKRLFVYETVEFWHQLKTAR
jgi:mannose-1-phosphate guanylyltransferase